MEAITAVLEQFSYEWAHFTVTIIEIFGMFIILYAVMYEAYTIIFKYKLNFFKINDDNHLNSCLSSALEVLLAAEILKTITINDYTTLVIIAVLILLRIAMTLLLVWETSHKAKHGGTLGSLADK